MAADSRRSWRLILSPAMAGSDNMALDEAILESVARRESRPTLRLYAWKPPCLSLGYAQPIAHVDQAALRRLGWDLVRRPTGGRAILHIDELTYAVVAPDEGEVFSGGVLPSYRRLSAALAAGLAKLSLAVETQPEGQPATAPSDEPICFQLPAAHEITVAGKKLLGSAQLRRRNAALQHGSLPLRGDLGRICQVLRYSNGNGRAAAREALLQRAATVEGLLGEPVTWERAAQAVVAGFQEALGLRFEQGDPAPSEARRAAQLSRERHASPAWIERI